MGGSSSSPNEIILNQNDQIAFTNSINSIKKKYTQNIKDVECRYKLQISKNDIQNKNIIQVLTKDNKRLNDQIQSMKSIFNKEYKEKNPNLILTQMTQTSKYISETYNQIVKEIQANMKQENKNEANNYKIQTFIDQKDQQILNLTNKKNDLQKLISTLKNEKQTNLKNIQEKQKMLFEEKNKQIQQIKKNITKKELQLSQQREKTSKLQQQIDKINGEMIPKMQNIKKQEQTKNQQMMKTISAKEQILTQKQKQLQQCLKKNQQMQKQLAAIKKTLQQKNQQLQNSHSESTQIRREYANLEDQQKTKKDIEQKMKEQIQKSKDQIQKLNEQITKLSQEIIILNRQKSEESERFIQQINVLKQIIFDSVRSLSSKFMNQSLQVDLSGNIKESIKEPIERLIRSYEQIQFFNGSQIISKDKINFLLKSVTDCSETTIQKTKLLMKIDPFGAFNAGIFHKLIDRKESICTVIKLVTGSIVGGYSLTPLNPDRVQRFERGKGIIFSVTHQKTFKMRRQANNRQPVFPYDDYNFLMGTAELRMSYSDGVVKFYSNIGVNPSCFQPAAGFTRRQFYGNNQAANREVAVVDFEIWQIELGNQLNQ